MFSRIVRPLLVIGALLGIAAPASATSITVLVGDKDWFGRPDLEGVTTPWSGNPADGVTDNRSSGEASASNGAQLTDLYSALYFSYPCDPKTDAGCSPNKDAATVLLPFSGTLLSGSITIRMGDFQCAGPDYSWGPIGANINGVNLPFCFSDGLQVVQTRTFTLDSAMIAAANQAGAVRLFLDHSGAYADPEHGIHAFGSTDYIAFDFFELDADVTAVPEPGTLVLFGLGAAAITISFLRAGARGRLRASTAGRRR